jgi:hypothetical protein
MTEFTSICPESVQRANRDLECRLSHMSETVTLRRYKLAKILVATIIVGGLTAFGILEGADPTVVAPLGILSIALLNGIEVAELASAYAEVRNVADGSSDGGDSSS